VKTVSAIITSIASNQGHGYATADDGRVVFINARFLPQGGKALIGREIEAAIVERYEAVKVRLVDPAEPAPAAKPSPAPKIAPAPEKMVSTAPTPDLPPAVANILSEPVRKVTKADRLQQS
jgi:hypothetical protein